MRDFFDFIAECFFPIALMLLFSLAIAVGIAWPVGAYECSTYQEVTGRETKHIFPAGCFVKSDGQFMPIKEFETRSMTNE